MRKLREVLGPQKGPDRVSSVLLPVIGTVRSIATGCRIPKTKPRFARCSAAIAGRPTAGEKEVAALWQSDSALREAEFGSAERAREEVKKGLALTSTRDVRILAALTLACSGDAQQAQEIADGLEKEFPLHTMLNQYWLPTVRGYLAIQGGRPTDALEFLNRASRYDLAFPLPQFSTGGTLYPPSVRGQVYLAMKKGKEAETEYQKIMDHRTIVANFHTFPLAQLGLARALLIQGDRAKASAVYQEFLARWKDADTDIPVLKQAKSEYAKLQ